MICLTVYVIKKLIFGLIIGIAAITPGLSGGVIAASFGIYEKIIDALCGLGKNFKKNFAFVLPYALGGGIGVLFFSNIMERLISYSYYEITYIFIGLVLGTIPSFLKEANNKGFKILYVFFAVLSFSISFVLGDYIKSIVSFSNFFKYILIGMIVSLGTLIPGLSSSFILMKAGLYNLYISAISDFKLVPLIYISFGFAAASILIIGIIKYMFNKHHGLSYYTVFGLLVGSVVMVFPGIRPAREAVVDFSLMYLSFVFSFLIMSFKA